MDSVQQFIANNSNQFGYIMQEAARQWAEKDPLGALTVGPCKGTVDVNGGYLELLDKLESIQKGNVYSCSIEMDTEEADKNVKELTAAANECVEAFDKLEKKLGMFTPSHLRINATNLVNDDAIKQFKRILSTSVFINAEY